MNVPKLRFNKFSAAWLKRKIGDVSNYTKGFAFKSEDYQDNGMRIVRVSDLSANSIKQNNQKIFIDLVKAEQYSNYQLNSGDIVITTVGSRPDLLDSAVGRGILISKNGEGLLNQNLLKLNNSSLIDNRFLFAQINTERYITHIKTIQRGNANQSNITLKDLFNFDVYITETAEQTKIANFLSAVDEKISQLTQKHELLNQYKKGVMHKIFSQKLRFKDDDGSEFPEWSKYTIGEVLIKNSSKNKKLEFNLVQSVSNKHGFINQDELFEDRVIASKDLSNYYIIKKHAFAYNPSRIDVGSLAYKKDDKVSVVSPLYVSFYAKSDFVFDAYLMNWFDNDEFKKQMINSFEGGVRNTLSYDSLSKMTISLPKLKEQTKIANFLTAIDEKITATQSQLELVKQYKQGLLQQMFI